MVWSEAQRCRLAVEKDKLESLFPSSTEWIDPMGATKVQVTMLSNSEKPYVLRVCLAEDFPNSCPQLLVVSPPYLHLKDGTPIPAQSYCFHTLEDVDGLVCICHFYAPAWTADNTLYQVNKLQQNVFGTSLPQLLSSFNEAVRSPSCYSRVA